jgi:hypothetical protein
MESSMGIFIVGLITLVAFVGIGYALIVMEKSSRKKAEQTKSWPEVSGTVLESEVKEHLSMDDMEGTASSTYEPVVKYSYSVAGQEYSSDRIGYGPNQFDSRTASKMVSRYPQGSTVTVRHHPDNPAEAVLESKVSGSRVILIIGIAFIVIGVVTGCGILGYWLVNAL